MREIPISNCEKGFILKAIQQKKRLDGRQVYDYRTITITFGVDRGCCTVQLGKTRVLVQVSCEVTEPKQSRPNEGLLFVNLELSPMAACHFEAGRQSDQGVEINRILERCIKESRCVDTESLCIVSGVKVWAVRVDIHVLNHDGNLIDCASIAAIAGLAHFRRPDVTVSGEDVTIHSLEDRDPVPLSVHHMPICVTFAFFDQGKYLLVDPVEREERVMDGKMVIGMNKHREICTFQSTGQMLLQKEQVLRCSNISVVKVTEITELIHRALENDSKARVTGSKFGFAQSAEVSKLTVTEKDAEEVDLSSVEDEATEILKNGADMETAEVEEVSPSKPRATSLGPGTAEIGNGGSSTWVINNSSDESDDDVAIISESQKKKSPPVVEMLSEDSEEEEVVMLDSGDIGATAKQRSPFKPGKGIDLSAALKKFPPKNQTEQRKRKS